MWARVLLWILCLVSTPTLNAQNVFSLENFEWADCPELQIDGITTQLATSLQIHITNLNLDTQCLQNSTSNQPLNRETLKALIQSSLNQIQNLGSQLPDFNLSIENLSIVDATRSYHTKLYLSHDAGHFDLKLNSKQGLELEALIDAQQLSINKLRVDEGFLKSFGFSLADELSSIALQGSLWPQLSLKAQTRLRKPSQSINLSIKHWENSLIKLESKTDFNFQQWLLPVFSISIKEQGTWSASAPELQLSAQGTWHWPTMGHINTLKTTGTLKANYNPLWLNYIPNLEFPKALQLLNAAINGSWQSQGLHLPELKLALSDGHALWDDISIDGLNIESKATQNSQGLWTHQGQLKLHQLDIGVPVTDIHAQWWQALARPIDDISALRVQALKFEVLQGIFSIPSLHLPLPSQASLSFRNLEMSQLTQLYPDLSLAAQGTLRGQLPLELSQQGLSIHDGHVRLDPARGYVRLSHPSVLEMKTQHQSLDFSLSLLEDFSFEQLHADVSLSTEGEMSFAARIQGFNQSVTPRRIDLNYTHQENIYQLMRSLRIGDELSGKLQEWIDRYSN
ncbi:hypothetical protein DBZ36_00635 [Alginatibacterium sediminis]|uniref:Uncharacterized protein n=1 Tax=Alginatibacterium sediminis TaxID=2164068 RepID=A0A420ENM2_9ALTE|nr:YdbH domain-containing protein [Alginatibacterium sediminis]RKF22186.1 hypothetical protein DBZ36_00635 [Alginatibacterium sediminis]